MDNWKVPVTRIRYTHDGVDQYGEPLPDKSTREELPPALYAPGGTAEPVQVGAQAVISQPTLYWPGEWPDVTATDRLEVEGTIWEVQGRPAAWPMGLAVTLKGVESA